MYDKWMSRYDAQLDADAEYDNWRDDYLGSRDYKEDLAIWQDEDGGTEEEFQNSPSFEKNVMEYGERTYHPERYYSDR